MHMLYERMSCTYLDVWEYFVDSFKLYKNNGVHLNDKGFKVFSRRIDECLSLDGK